MKRVRSKNRKEGGQAIIEFILVITIMLTMIFVFVQLSWAIAWGHYVHYATYMSARAYYSAGSTKQDQLTRAQEVLQSLLKNKAGQDLLPLIAKSRGGDDRDTKGPEPVTGAFIGMHPVAQGGLNNRAFAWAEGVQYNFEVPLYLLPIAGWVKTEGAGKTIVGGTAKNPTKGIEWRGSIPFTSDSYLGREQNISDCLDTMDKLSTSGGISRADGAHFLEDNGC